MKQGYNKLKTTTMRKKNGFNIMLFVLIIILFFVISCSEGSKQNFAGALLRADTSFILSWKPAFEKIAASGELGYTYGYYTRTIKSTGVVSRGTYVTIWVKQKDGSWKFVLDAGTDGLPGD
jgi:ketosteroid isomerase-like protein